MNEANTATNGSEHPATDIITVGLGASAGGLAALQEFFGAMPSQSGMAFIVVMHLSPDFDSSLPQILATCTKMEVVQVHESVLLERDHVYVIPPGKHLSVEQGRISTVDVQQPAGRRIAIDFLFRTLSAAIGPRAVSVVLSGTDSDGVIGLKHVKEQGGLTIAQDPNEAQFDSMPRSAIATGMVDWILPVSRIPQQLMEFIANERRMHIPPESPRSADEAGEQDTAVGGPPRVARTTDQADEDALAEVLRLLHSHTGHDFAHYKRATVLRRVARRLQVNLLERIPDYLDYLRTHPVEIGALMNDLLISVTNFFRDADAFRVLESHIPQLFAGKSSIDQVRVWVAGCATGEEAYSIAILLNEHASKLDAPPRILVFATDLDEDVIQIARSGIYSTTIEADVSQERLRRYFQQDHGRYRIKKEIRELVLFSPHNLLHDSPFSRLDLVTCRNLLIYLKPEAQTAVFDTFHFALRPGGLLFLGNSENVDDGSPLFGTIDKKTRLFVRAAASRSNWRIPAMMLQSSRLDRMTDRERMMPSTSPTGGAITSYSETGQNLAGTEPRGALPADLHLALLEEIAPPSILVDSNHNIVHLSETAGRYLQMSGTPSMNVLRAIHPSLQVELRMCLYGSVQSGSAMATHSIAFNHEGSITHVNMQVRQLTRPDSASNFILIVFNPLTDQAARPEPQQSEGRSARQFTEQVDHLKSQLESTVDQYEATFEELKASNEELQAMNEELRAATEELETSKEELQSMNEELHTVNHELKNNITELSRANSDLQNLMAATNIATVFLDRNRNVIRFTPSSQALFNLIASDIGRPLSDITHKLDYTEISPDVEKVLTDLNTVERELRSENSWYLCRILPYRTSDDHIDGAVLTFVDISARKAAEGERIRLEKELAVLEERNRLARDLHDILSQGFTAIKFQMDAAEMAIEGDKAILLERIVQSREIAQQSLVEARSSVFSLFADVFEPDGLRGALRMLAERTAVETAIDFECIGEPCALPGEIELALYRIGQEAVTNALRHAAADRIRMELEFRDTHLHLRVEDNGVGFEADERHNGVGMYGMRERALQVGGVLNVSSVIGAGTSLAVAVPLRPPDSARPASV